MTVFDQAWDVVKTAEIGQPDDREWCEECGEWHFKGDMEHTFRGMMESLEPSGEQQYDWIWNRPDDDCGRKFQQAVSKLTWRVPFQFGNGHESFPERKLARNPHYEPKPLGTYDPNQLARYLEIEIQSLMSEVDDDGKVFSGPLNLAQDFRRVLDNYYECTGMPMGDGK